MALIDLVLDIIPVIGVVVAVIMTIYFARQQSERIYLREKYRASIKISELDDEILRIKKEMEEKIEFIEEQDTKINILQDEIGEKELELFNKEEELKIMEEVSSRDIEYLRSKIEELTGMVQQLTNIVIDFRTRLIGENKEE